MRKLVVVGLFALAATVGVLSDTDVATSDDGRLLQCDEGVPVQSATYTYRDAYSSESHFATAEQAAAHYSGQSTPHSVTLPNLNPAYGRAFAYVHDGRRVAIKTFSETRHGWVLAKVDVCAR